MPNLGKRVGGVPNGQCFGEIDTNQILGENLCGLPPFPHSNPLLSMTLLYVLLTQTDAQRSWQAQAVRVRLELVHSCQYV